MTVNQLISILQSMDGGRVVILQRDAEGNGYSPLYAVDDNCRYAADTTWSGEVGLEVLTPQLESCGFGPHDVADGGVPAVVLSPVN